jgi:hypothetical protein
LYEAIQDEKTVDIALQIMYDTLNFSEEKYHHHREVQNEATKRYIERKKEGNEGNPSYESQKAYYHRNKETILKKRAEAYKQKTNAGHFISFSVTSFI